MNTYQLGALLSGERESIVSLVPLTERRGIDRHDRALGQRLGTHELVVAGIVDNVDDSGLSGDTLRVVLLLLLLLLFLKKFY